MKRKAIMSLTPELVALCERSVADPGPEPGGLEMSEAEIHEAAGRLDRECADRPLWLFAYGSLIWKPAFDHIETRRANAAGWHRSFCMTMHRWRGSAEQPGLMMAIMRGGICATPTFDSSKTKAEAIWARSLSVCDNQNSRACE